MHKMKALLKEGKSVAVRGVPEPVLRSDREIIVRVALAGLCRTDLYAAESKIKTADPLVLGHEFSGIVERVGAEVEDFSPGDHVTVNPLLPCRQCRLCLNGAHATCRHSEFLGIDRHGSFAELIAVPECAAYRLPADVSFLAAAYTEPVAACLAVLKTGITSAEIGLIYGQNRFSQLVAKILNAYGFNNLEVYDPASPVVLEEDHYDFVIETVATTETINGMLRAIRPGGKIILKSRQHEPVMLKLNEVIKKEPIMHAVNYGSFEEALDLLASGRIAVEDLVDGVYELEEFEKVFAGAKNSEALKPFFSLTAV